MRNVLKIAALFSITGIVYYSCRKDPESYPLNFGYNYLPGAVGSYIIYEVDSISYDDAFPRPPDTVRYLLKEVIASAFTDNTGKPALRIERFMKLYNDSVPYDSLPWTGPKVWHANLSSNDYQKVEENVRYLRLVFPVKEGKQWNGNTYNSFEEKEYEIISADKQESVNSISFDSVLTVKQFERVNIIEYRYEAEKYARNIGLIYKERDSLYDGGGPDTVGFTVKQKIVSYGK